MDDGGVLKYFEFESSTLTIVVKQIITLKTTKSKFYVANPCTDLISALGIYSIMAMEISYQLHASQYGAYWKQIILSGLEACSWCYAHHRGSE